MCERKHQSVTFRTPPTRNLAHKQGMYPDWESNQQTFGYQASTQPTGPHQPGPKGFFKEAKETGTPKRNSPVVLQNVLAIKSL